MYGAVTIVFLASCASLYQGRCVGSYPGGGGSSGTFTKFYLVLPLVDLKKLPARCTIFSEVNKSAPLPQAGRHARHHRHIGLNPIAE